MNNESLQAEPSCCPQFNPIPWDNKMFEWKNKKFIKDKVFTLFYIPINFGCVIKRMIAKVEKAESKMSDWLCLADHTSKWNMDLYLAVGQEIPGATNVTLSGKYVSKVYEGPFRRAGQWVQDFKSFVKTKGFGFEAKKIYFWYTTCPKCAKKYGKNYVVLFGEV